MKKQAFRTMTALFLCTTSPMVAGTALAQDGGEAGAAETATATNDGEIFVTATRRASPLSDVPIAVSAVTATSMQNSGANDLRQLNQLAPSLLISSTGTEANGSARIRGIGTVGDNPGLESSVAVFIDGVYRARTGAGLNELGAIDRVEVLRGPQGTLFGRNASAGLINVVTREPDFTFGAEGEITYGNYDYWRLVAGVTGPFSDTLALRLDGVYSKRDGFFDIVDAAGNEVGETNTRDRFLLRGQALFEPTPDLRVRLIADYSERDESCCGAAYISKDETFDPTPGSPGDFATNPTNRIVTILERMGAVSPDEGDPFSRNISITPGRSYISDMRDWGISGEITYNFGGVELTSITAYRDYRSADSGDYDYNTIDILYREEGTQRRFRTFTQELRLQGSAFDDRLDWLVGGYYAHETLNQQDRLHFGADYGAFAACRALAGSGPQASPLLPLLDPTQPGCMSPIARGAVGAQLGPVAGIFLPALDRLSQISDVGDEPANFRQTSENYALFTHNIVHLTDRLDLTLGLRYTHEQKDVTADFNNTNTICPQQQAALSPFYGVPSLAATAIGIVALSCQGNSSVSLNALKLQDGFSDDEFSGTAVLSYEISDPLMVYASYSRGYKAGGYNLERAGLGSALAARSNADVANLIFEPETVDAYEIGAKYSAGGLSVSLAAFRQEFESFQLNTFNGSIFLVQNINGCSSALQPNGQCTSGDVAAGVVTKGVELEISANPMRDLRLNGGVTYARARYADRLVGNSDGTVPLDPALFLLPGQQMSNAPDTVVTGSAAWTPDLGSSGLSALFYVDARYTDSYNTGSDLFPEKVQESYTLVNARVGLRGPDEAWSIELWAQNLFDKDYTQVAFNAPFQGGGSVAQVIQQGLPSAQQLFAAYLAEPRTFGITLRGQF